MHTHARTVAHSELLSPRDAGLTLTRTHKVECIVPDIDEKAIGDRASDPERLVLAVATAKADALVARWGCLDAFSSLHATPRRKRASPHAGVFFFSRSRLADEGRLSELGRRGAVLVCGDQVVTYNGAVREKPADADEARAYIADYGLAPCSTVGALVLHDAASGRRASGVHVAHIHFNPFPPAVVDALAADPVCRRCAGGLMVEHPACAPYLRQIDGGVDSVMGLSTRLLATLLGSLSDGAS